MTRYEVIQLLGTDIDHVFVHDKDYAQVTSQWFLGEGCKWVENVFKLLGVHNWKSTFDCDNRASLARSLFRLCHSESGNRPEQAILVAEVCFESESYRAKHAVVAAYTEREWVYLELGIWKEIELNESELWSRYYARC